MSGVDKITLETTIKGLELVLPLQSLIDEMVMESLIEDYSLHRPMPIDSLLRNEEYIRGVLGIDIPLNESYPYSFELQERILEEQLLLEGFFDDAKELGGNVKKAALALRYIVEDPGRIKDFMKNVYEVVLKNPMEKLVSILRKALDVIGEKGKALAVKGYEKINEWFSWLLSKLEDAWGAVKSSTGWKGALAAVAVGAGVYYIWDNYEDIWEGLQEMIEKLVEFGKKAAKKGKKAVKGEALVVPALGQLLLSENDDVINEFLGGIFGKKNKGADDMGLELSAGEPVPTAGILISPEQAKKAGIKGKTEDEAEEEKEDPGSTEDSTSDSEGGEDEEQSMVQKIIEFVKEKLVDVLADKVKGLAADAIMGAVSGGIGAFIKTVGAIYGGAKFVAKILGQAAEPFISKIKNPEEEMEEMEQGEDDPTEATWHDNEKLIREYVREKLLAS